MSKQPASMLYTKTGRLLPADTDSLYSLSGIEVPAVHLPDCFPCVFGIGKSRWEDNEGTSTAIMSISFSSDCFSNLLCDEDSSGFLSGDSLECSSEIQCASDVEESIAACIEEERQFVPGFDYFSRFQTSSLDASARADSVAWILLVQAYYGFHPLTAYLAVNYLDRFIYSHRLAQANGWPLQLLSVACLSLAAKMEEPLAPCLLDLQAEGAKYVFEPKTICRMELLVLRVLDWRLRSITPYNFVEFFAFKIDPTGAFIRFLISRASEIILSNIEETSFLEYRPSCIAATALLCAANEIPSLPLVNPEDAELWCNGLSKERLVKCYQLTQKLVLHGSRRRPPKILPQLRVTLQAEMRLVDSSPMGFSSSSMSYKRRKLSTCLWVVNDKGNSE